MSKTKLISLILTLAFVVGLLAGCGTTPTTATDSKIYQGLGQVQAFRVGPGKDKKDVQVYSFTYLTAVAQFDKDGKILNVYFDSLEVSTPNYDGESMPHFSGWPGITGYNVTDHATGDVLPDVSKNTNESITAEVNGWQTKRERGDKYGMNMANDWHKQADFYQKFFVGKTVADIEAWFAKYCSDVNGRPLKDTSKNEKDIAKLAKLTDAEKKELTDVLAGATMSLKDAHGDFIGALKKAYANKMELNLTPAAAKK